YKFNYDLPDNDPNLKLLSDWYQYKFNKSSQLEIDEIGNNDDKNKDVWHINYVGEDEATMSYNETIHFVRSKSN
ncbi:TPA: Csa1 family protein, partial [Staphylococcus aureus]|nr:Csa1 family protein [Staphylococcus aureus]